MPRSRSRAAIRIASSSDVVVREVAKRKWSTSSSPRNIPKWVCVLPTSIVRSTGGLSTGSEVSEALDALSGEGREGPLERLAPRWIQLEERLEDEAPRLDLCMRDAVVRRVDLLPLD